MLTSILLARGLQMKQLMWVYANFKFTTLALKPRKGVNRSPKQRYQSGLTIKNNSKTKKDVFTKNI